MNSQYRVPYLGRPLSGVVCPPGSKSITNRALICAAAADGESRLLRALKSEDTQMMIDGLNQLGVSVFWQGDDVSSAVHLRRRDGVVLKRSSKIENY